MNAEIDIMERLAREPSKRVEIEIATDRFLVRLDGSTILGGKLESADHAWSVESIDRLPAETLRKLAEVAIEVGRKY